MREPGGSGRPEVRSSPSFPALNTGTCRTCWSARCSARPEYEPEGESARKATDMSRIVDEGNHEAKCEVEGGDAQNLLDHGAARCPRQTTSVAHRKSEQHPEQPEEPRRRPERGSRHKGRAGRETDGPCDEEDEKKRDVTIELFHCGADSEECNSVHGEMHQACVQKTRGEKPPHLSAANPAAHLGKPVHERRIDQRGKVGDDQ